MSKNPKSSSTRYLDWIDSSQFLRFQESELYFDMNMTVNWKCQNVLQKTVSEVYSDSSFHTILEFVIVFKHCFETLFRFFESWADSNNSKFEYWFPKFLELCTPVVSRIRLESEKNFLIEPNIFLHNSTKRKKNDTRWENYLYEYFGN